MTKKDTADQKGTTSLWKHEKLYVMNWEVLGRCLQKITDQMISDSFHPGAIAGISRGGLIAATYFANILDIENFHILGIVRNISNTRYSGKKEPELLWAASYANLTNQSVLLVDDIVGEGKTMSLAVKFLEEKGALCIKTATLVRQEKALFKPDYSAVILDDWIVFPWEKTVSSEEKRFFLKDV